MRYALRKQEKISSVLGSEYLTEHIIQSLESHFKIHSESDIIESLDDSGSSSVGYPVLRINDLADENCMLEFAVIGQKFDVLHLSFLGRMKG